MSLRFHCSMTRDVRGVVCSVGAKVVLFLLFFFVLSLTGSFVGLVLRVRLQRA